MTLAPDIRLWTSQPVDQASAAARSGLMTPLKRYVWEQRAAPVSGNSETSRDGKEALLRDSEYLRDPEGDVGVSVLCTDEPRFTMKCFPMLLLLAAALPASGAPIVPDTSFPTSDRQSMRIHMEVEPIFPPTLVAEGITAGQARIVISVSHEGVLKDTLVVAYTHKAFADAALEALERWKFDPMFVRGQAMSSQTELYFDFRATGVVVSLTLADAVSRLAHLPVHLAYAPCRFKDLDRIPTPLLADPPMYPTELRDSGIHGDVTIEFYIDENGTVRMPVVVAADHQDLGFLALQAVTDWRFEAPTQDGRPVLARVRQVFHFREGQLVASGS